MKKHKLATTFSILLLVGAVSPALADDRPAAGETGFYGGVSIRDHASETMGLSIGPATTVWNRFGLPTADDTAPRSLAFAGYRWRNDIAVEAAFNTTDQYALRPPGAFGAPRGVGLSFGSTPGLGDTASRGWNLDVFTSWNFYRAFALYGRLGYAQGDSTGTPGAVAFGTSDSRRFRDGVNYGLGLRYDMSPALGLRLEYGRFGRFAGEIGNGLPETDQVTFGVQFRF